MPAQAGFVSEIKESLDDVKMKDLHVGDVQVDPAQKKRKRHENETPEEREERKRKRKEKKEKKEKQKKADAETSA